MNKKQLQDILRKHELWLKGDKDGVRANLSNANHIRKKLKKMYDDGVQI